MYHIIVNPSAKSGMGHKQWKKLKKVLNLTKMTYIVHFTKSGKDTTQYTRSITDKSLYEHNATLNRIIVLGGDGTLNCVINGIDDLEHTIVTYLPTGTSNDFARALHISADSINTVATMKKGGINYKTDLGLASFGRTTRRFAVSCGIGYDAAVCQNALGASAKGILNRMGLGKLTYCAIALKQLLFVEPVSCDLYLDDKPPIHYDRFLFAAFMQQPYEGGGFKFCPKADPTDGKLDICLVGDVSKLRVLRLLPLAPKGRHIGHSGIHNYRAKTVRIVTSKPLCVHTDGEIGGCYTQLKLTSSDIPLTIRK